MDKVQIGWFSEQAAALCGTSLFRMADGSIREITFVTSEEDAEAANYAWKDKVKIGRVACYHSAGRPGENEVYLKPKEYR